MKKIIAAAFAAAAALSLVACVGVASEAATVKRTTATSAAVVGTTTGTWAGYGDSNMARDDSWVHQFSDTGLTQVGGYYRNGYTSGQVLASMNTAPAGVNLAVIQLGTNDVTQSVSTSTVCSNIVAISDKAGAPHTLVVALAPQSNTTSDSSVDRRTKTIIMNRDLTICALEHGYLFADPWAFQRAWTGAWGTGADIGDGTHPTTLVAGQVATKMPTYMRQALVGTTN